ncbi:random slug protein 5-like, partial [Carica papaya]|uniref:random slug protein 5-like n=1 Tax=Carica papaya TaxID=3649 RepID=UPI000B8CFA48
MGSNQLRGSASQKLFSPEDQQAKINEVKKIIGGIADKLPEFCSDESISRYLRARNWNTKKAAKMLKETLKWRLQSKPEKITWEDVVDEAETGKVYRANFCDKNGRIVLIMRPGLQ